MTQILRMNADISLIYIPRKQIKKEYSNAQPLKNNPVGTEFTENHTMRGENNLSFYIKCKRTSRESNYRNINNFTFL